MNNFRNYATQLRSKAAAVAQNIPTFDDMAANDDYIHSEEFNVRGQPRPTAKSNETTSGGTTTDMDAVLPDEASSASSWSLLDRPAQPLVSARMPPNSEVEAPTPRRPQLHMTDSSITSLSSDAPSSVNNQSTTSGHVRRPSNASSKNLPLLSVVASALEEGTVSNESEDASLEEDTDSEEDDDDDDGDDPIMSFVREQKPLRQESSLSKNKKKLRVQTSLVSKDSKTKHSKRRFMDDDRLIDTTDTTQPTSMPLSTTTTAAPQAPAMQTLLNTPLGSWVKNKMPKNTPIGRFFQKQTLVDVELGKPPPPLARERKALQKAPEEHFALTSSSSMLEDDELAQLAKFQASSKPSWSSQMVQSLHEHRQFAFILFTLILAFFVYYFQQSADGVT